MRDIKQLWTVASKQKSILENVAAISVFFAMEQAQGLFCMHFSNCYNKKCFAVIMTLAPSAIVAGNIAFELLQV